jgi:hypothetical protein
VPVLKRRFQLSVAGLCLVIILGAGLVVKRKGFPFVHREIKWSIGIYTGNSPVNLKAPDAVENPVLTAKQVTDVPADFVADPFMVNESSTWYMFFEVLNKSNRRGEIGLATSTDSSNWTYQRIVLSEPFHLSYPYVFKSNGSYYMIPESGAAHSIRLYRAVEFPTKWEFAKTLLSGSNYVDSSIFEYSGRWWLFTTSNDDNRSNDNLRLFFADDLLGPWQEHPSSPVVRDDSRIARGAGRVLVQGHQIVRYAHDVSQGYGTQVRALLIKTLTPSVYEEAPLTDQPIVKRSGSGWNENGMHHVDAHQLENGKWVACVDGKGPRMAFRFGK